LLTDSAIDTVAAAIFEKPLPFVSEAYSAYDAEPITFHSAPEVAQYIRRVIDEPRGLAFFFVVYPDMGGSAIRETIRLKPGSVPGHKLRYTWQGWGLISLQLTRGNQPGSSSRVAANSLARAKKWVSTHPEWDPPGTWNWSAVASHTRRLQRVLRGIAK
jgi:hypothetical protein